MLILLRGVSGSGKTTLVRDVLSPGTALSQDQIREELLGTQQVPGEHNYLIIKEFRRRLEQRMELQRLTVVDDTNLRPKDIKGLVEVAERYENPYYILNFISDPDVISERLEKRRSGVAYGSVLPVEEEERQRVRYVQNTPTIMQQYAGSYYGGDYDAVRERLITLLASRNVHEVTCDNVYVLGDIHGCLSQLKVALDYMPSESVFFTVGDMIDRGEDSMGTLEAVRNDPRFVAFTMGNHENAFLNELKPGGYVKSTPRRVTHEEYNRLEPDEAKEIESFLRSGKTYLLVKKVCDDETVLLSHTGVGELDPECITIMQGVKQTLCPKEDYVPEYEYLFERQIHGHYAWDYTGDFSGKTINIDSGCGKNGNLTVYAPFDPSLTFQVTPDGKIIDSP